MWPFLEWLRPRTAAMTRLLGRFVRAESPSIDKAAMDRFGRMVSSEWRRRGAGVTFLRQRERGDHVRAEWNPRRNRGQGQILVLGHMDTVYGMGTVAKTPFRLSRGRAFGPGTFDMKGGLVIALFAVDALAAAGRMPGKRIVFLLTSDEEIGSATSRESIEREARRSDAVLVLEPAAGLAGSVKTSRKGVGEIEIVAAGRAAHAGLNPGEGVNAIEEIALQIARVSRWNELGRGITVNAGVIEGGTRTNVIPDKARVLVDVRAERAGDMRALERKFRRSARSCAGQNCKFAAASTARRWSGNIAPRFMPRRGPWQKKWASRLAKLTLAVHRTEILRRRWASQRSMAWARSAKERTARPKMS